MKPLPYQIKETQPGYFAVIEIQGTKEAKRQEAEIQEYLSRVARGDAKAYRIN